MLLNMQLVGCKLQHKSSNILLQLTSNTTKRKLNKIFSRIVTAANDQNVRASWHILH